MAVADELPAHLRPPLPVVLARAVDTLPAPDALPGHCLYEPKWDGYRLQVVREPQRVTLWSRQGKDLTSRFPDLAEAVAEQVAPGTILDGEVVAWVGDRLQFTALAARMAGSSATIARAARKTPVSYAVFDVLVEHGRDCRDLPYTARRTRLDSLATNWRPPLSVSPTTEDRAVALGWLDALAVAGIEGIVIKGAAQTYRGGTRTWLKVKHRDTLNVVCAAVLGPIEHPEALVVGLPIDGRLRIVGRTTALPAPTARALGRTLQAAMGDHPWPPHVTSAAISGFGRRREVQIARVHPLVVEVSADTAWSGTAFRHQLRFVRARPELDPADVQPPGPA